MATEIEELKSRIDNKKIPRHVAIIMDGNGRWAQKRHKPRVFGHNEGIKTVRRICEICGDLNEIKILTLYAFSKENWQRPNKEVKILMHLLRRFLKDEIDEMNANGIKLDVIGRTDELPDFVKKVISEAKSLTKNNKKFILNLALNYSSRLEITDAVNKLLKTGKKEYSIKDISDNLYTAKFEYPDPDLLIRTSGEFRISNFLLWQLSYSEIYITDTLWPDFTKTEFLKAIIDFQHRERRFGKVLKNG